MTVAVAHGSRAQRTEWDRPVNEERHSLMSGPQQEELRRGLQQQDAIWPRSRQLPEINAIPSVPLSLFNNNNSLSSSLLDNSRLPSYFCTLLPALLSLSSHQLGSVSNVPPSINFSFFSICLLLFLIFLCLAVSIFPLPPVLLSLSPVTAQPVSECTKHSLRLV